MSTHRVKCSPRWGGMLGVVLGVVLGDVALKVVAVVVLAVVVVRAVAARESAINTTHILHTLCTAPFAFSLRSVGAAASM